RPALSNIRLQVQDRFRFFPFRSLASRRIANPPLQRLSLLCSGAMRLFVALDIDEEIRHRIAEFIERVRRLAPDARWVSAESVHVTLKFIGEKPDAMVGDIESALKTISGEPFRVSFRGCGFFPTAKSARVFWAGIDADSGLAALAEAVESTLRKL